MSLTRWTTLYILVRNDIYQTTFKIIYSILDESVLIREARLRARDMEIRKFQAGQVAERQRRLQEEREEAKTFRWVILQVFMGDDSTPGRGIRDMMRPEAGQDKHEAVDRRRPKDVSYP